MSGQVYLVGSGPGDPDLITLKGYKKLLEADSVFIDRLAPDELLEDIDDETTVVDCGKQPHGHRLTQEEINETLLSHAREDRTVVRLKGGDPMIFGRGGEEFRYLRDHGIDVELIPGITAGTAVSSLLGVPLTDREVASEVTFLTGHEAPNKDADNLDWDCMANCRKTLVIYMGVSNMKTITQRLVERGRPADTPACVVERAYRNGQKIVQGQLNTIYERAREENVDPPAVMLVGETVGQFRQRASSNPTTNEVAR